MAENSHISWTDNTHNEWIGCTKVSAGCDNCYAEREQDIRYGRAKWGKGNARYRTSEANRRKPFTWDRAAARAPWVCPACVLPGTCRDNAGLCHRCGATCVPNRPRVFTASLSDVFDEEVPDAWRDELFDTIRKTPNLDWLVLTKRLAKMLRYSRDLARKGAASVPKNIWWGCSVENQETANQRIPELLKLRQWVGNAPLWLSIEPLLGPIDLQFCRGLECDWVIVGGESGPAARPMHPDWPRSLRDQCVAAGVAFHFKQWGEYAPNWLNDNNNGGKKIAGSEWMDRMGKKAAGRLLDGREWNEFPKVLK